MPNENHSNISDEEEVDFIRNLHKGFGKYKRKLPFSASTMEKLGILPPNVPIQSRKRVMMNKLKIIKNLRREKMETRRSSTRKRKTSTPKKTIIHLT